MTEKGDRQAVDAQGAEGEAATDKGELAFTDPQAVERRVWRNIFAVIIAGLFLSALFSDLRFTLGLILGSALALLNYKWLQSSLKAVLEVGSARTPPGTHIKFVARWLLIATIAWAAHETGYFDAVGILAGLFAPAIAIMIEAAYVTYKTITERGGE
jgi:hypothetical protein